MKPRPQGQARLLQLLNLGATLSKGLGQTYLFLESDSEYNKSTQSSEDTVEIDFHNATSY